MSNITPQMQQALAKADAEAANRRALIERNKAQAALLLRVIQLQIAQRPIK